MMQPLTIGASTVLAAAFLFLPLNWLVGSVPQLAVALSIMAAAVLVRLNRGMPAIDWRSIKVNERRQLTDRLVEVTGEYLRILAIEAVTLVYLVGLGLVFAPGRLTAGADWQRIFSGGAGFLLALSLARMGYVVWRDYDIVRLQKKILDDSAEREAVEEAAKSSAEKIQAMNAAGLRSPRRAEPKAWNAD